jgi:hypothetical protein
MNVVNEEFVIVKIVSALSMLVGQSSQKLDLCTMQNVRLARLCLVGQSVKVATVWPVTDFTKAKVKQSCYFLFYFVVDRFCVRVRTVSKISNCCRDVFGQPRLLVLEEV